MGYQEFLLLTVLAIWGFVVWKTVQIARRQGRKSPVQWGIISFILTSPALFVLPGVALLAWLAMSKPKPHTPSASN